MESQQQKTKDRSISGKAESNGARSIYTRLATVCLAAREYFQKGRNASHTELCATEEAESRQLCVIKRVLCMRGNVLVLRRVYGEASRGCVLDACCDE